MRPTGHETRLMQAKNWYFEAEMEAGNYQIATSGFTGIRARVSKRTRIYLEATSLLAICHLRQKNLDEAEPLIHEALNSKAISGEKRRKQFINKLTERFEEEGALAALIDSNDEELNVEKIQNEAGILIQSKTQEELEKAVGESIPPATVDFILKIHELSKKQLPEHELKYLPSPRYRKKKIDLGKKIIKAFNRVLWKSICDPNSDVRKAWVNGGLMAVLDRKYITTAIVASLSGMRIGIYALAVTMTALIFRIGLDTFCDLTEPTPIMDERSR